MCSARYHVMPNGLLQITADRSESPRRRRRFARRVQ
jgi:hypothetical protein